MLGLLSWVNDTYPSLSLSVWGPMSHHCHRRTSSLEREYPGYLLWAQNGPFDKLSKGPTVLEDSMPCLARVEFWNIEKMRTSKKKSHNVDVFWVHMLEIYHKCNEIGLCSLQNAYRIYQFINLHGQSWDPGWSLW